MCELLRENFQVIDYKHFIHIFCRYTVHEGTTIIRQVTAMNADRPERAHGRKSADGLAPSISGLLAGCISLCLAHPLQAVQPAAPEPTTRFQRTVQHLQEAAPELRSEFAAIALSSMASAYAKEAQLAREQARKAGKSSHLWAWSVKVDRYADQMSLLLEDVELGLPVRLTLAGEKSLTVVVADRTIILSHPRLNEQSAFEQDILRVFCTSNSCGDVSPEEGLNAPIPVSSAQIRPDWTFNAQQSLCTYRGITVRFNSTQNMANARLICEQLLQEILVLTEELAWQQRHAVTIEWDRLALQPTPHSPEHRVQINTLGDTVLVTIPMLYRSSALLAQILPWIRQTVDGQQGISVVLDADRFGWQKP